MLCRFIGNESTIEGEGSVKLDSFGQKVDLSESMFRDAVMGGCVLIRDSDFHFTDDEIVRYRYPASRAVPDPEFKQKFLLAMEAYGRERETFEAAYEADLEANQLHPERISTSKE